MTYGELEAWTNRVGHYLRARGVREEMLVPVCVQRSVEMIVGILGILKAGAAYVPIDPAYPVDRVRYMLEDTGSGVVVVSGKECRERVMEAGAPEMIDLEGDGEAIGGEREDRLGVKVSGESLAYVIYTSGSTGRPKGVLVEHKSLGNLVDWHNRRYQVKPSSKATVLAGIGFDASVWEMWPYLCHGACLCLVQDVQYFSSPELDRKSVV